MTAIQSIGGLLEDDLRRIIAERKALVIVGAGVAIGATNNAPTASWTGLLESGIDYCVALGRDKTDWADRRRLDLGSGNLDELLSVADQVSNRLQAPSGGDFATWLRKSVGSLRVHGPSGDVLKALVDLGVPLATTNYDGLLEEVSGLQPVTWRNRSLAEQVLRGDELGILHLHGYWNDPESVVLGTRSYERVGGDAHAQAILRGLRLVRNLLFVGFGAGLADPNFGALLKWTREAFEQSEYRQFRLARRDEVDALQRQHPPAERLFVIPYGEKREDLAPFLRSLAYRPGQTGDTLNVADDNLGSSAHKMLKVWNVPHDRNPDFTGREDLLDQIASALGNGREAAIVPINTNQAAVHGLGGIGKTQVTVEYLYRHRNDYEIVWWVRAEESATLAADYSSLAGELGLSVEGIADQVLTIKAVRNWLEETKHSWILVFDNAPAHEVLSQYLPRNGTGHVLITSRNRIWPSGVLRCDIQVLNSDESAAYLMRRILGVESDARALASELGHLPLALAQAASYADNRGLSFSGYLDRFREHRTELLRRGHLANYPDTVATTWNLSFNAAVEQCFGAASLMNMLAFLAPEAIPLDLIATHHNQLPDELGLVMADQPKLDDAIIALRHYSLVENTADEVLSVHRLVQYVTRDRLNVRDQRSWVTAVISTINSAFPNEAHDVRFWPDSMRLLPHALAVTHIADELNIQSATMGQLLNRVGRYLSGRALYPQGQSAIERALELREQVLGPEHSEVATDLSDLSVIRAAQGENDVARQLDERALAIREKALGPDHPDTATSLSNLAVTLGKQGDYAGAQRLLERALSINEMSLGPDHPDTAVCLSYLAVTLGEQGDLAGARELKERALSIFEKALGPDHPDTAVSLNKLAATLGEQGDLAGARELKERALSVFEKALGPDHPDTAASLSDLAMTLSEQGDLAGAQLLLERALTIHEKREDRSAVARLHKRLGDNLIRQRIFTDAVRHLRSAVTIHQELSDRISEAGDFETLAVCAQETNRRSDSRRLAMLAWVTFDEVHNSNAKRLKRILGRNANQVATESARAEYKKDRGASAIRSAFGKSYSSKPG